MMDPELVRKIQELGQRIDALTLPEVGAQPVWLDEPWTNTDFDGDSFSDVGAHTKIENTSWSTTIPSNAKALVIRAVARDSGSAATLDNEVRLYSTDTATNPAHSVRPAGITNDAITENQGIVPCTDGDIWYQIDASGANTMDVWLQLVGYWL